MEDSNLIGVGAFGNVYKAKYFGTPVAIKEMLNIEDLHIKNMIAREVILLKEVRHPNCVSWMGVCSHQGNVLLVTEYVAGGDLRNILKKNSIELTWYLITKICVDICSAMTYLHSKQIMHRDLKSKMY